MTTSGSQAIVNGLLRLLGTILHRGERSRLGWARRVFVRIFLAGVAVHGVSILHAPLGGKSRVLTPIAHGERQLILRQSLITLAVKVKHAAEVDVRPGLEPLLPG